MKEIIKVKKLREDAILPKVATEGSAGADLYACLYDEQTNEKLSKIVLQPNQCTKIHTGLAFNCDTYDIFEIIPIKFDNTYEILGKIFSLKNQEIIFYVRNNSYKK